MFRQVVRYNGAFYIIRYTVWGREWYDQEDQMGLLVDKRIEGLCHQV